MSKKPKRPKARKKPTLKETFVTAKVWKAKYTDSEGIARSLQFRFKRLLAKEDALTFVPLELRARLDWLRPV